MREVLGVITLRHADSLEKYFNENSIYVFDGVRPQGEGDRVQDYKHQFVLTKQGL